MASSVAIAQVQPSGFARRIVALIPGIALLAAVGYAGKFLERTINVYGKAHHLTLPNIEYVLWAILIGAGYREYQWECPAYFQVRAWRRMSSG